jgi:RNA recognition motif-containing protein
VNIYIRNLSPDIVEDDLRELFSPYGSVTTVTVAHDDSGRSRGFGFVEMPDESEAINAISLLNNMEFSGRKLRVQESFTPSEEDAVSGDNGEDYLYDDYGTMPYMSRRQVKKNRDRRRVRED